MFGKLAQRFLDVGALVCGVARPTPPATWDVASQIAPHGAGKSNRKRKRSNAFSSATPVFLFVIASALREAHDGSGPATAGAWGRHQPPHESILTLLSKIISIGFMPTRASFGIKRPAFTWGCGGGVSPRKWRHFFEGGGGRFLRWRGVGLDVGGVARESGRD